MWVRATLCAVILLLSGAACDLLEEGKSTPNLSTASALTPTPAGFPTQVRNSMPSPTVLPTPEPTVASRLEDQLPRTVFEAFHDSFYSGCSEPPFEELSVAQTWSGEGDSLLEFLPPDGTYFLVVDTVPLAAEWSFDSVVETAEGRRSRSLSVTSVVPDVATDAQEWCTESFGAKATQTFEVTATNLTWTLYLITTNGGRELPKTVAGALSGYYGDCPALPAIRRLEVGGTWTSSEEAGERSLEFNSTPPFYFLGVHFDPEDSDWSFQSTDVSGDWRSAGPAVNSLSRQVTDFSAICPQSSSPHHLEVVSAGGSWTVFLIISIR